MSETRYIAREVAAAGLGCAVVDGFFNPLEVLKVRIQNETVSTSKFTMMHAANRIVTTEGIFGLWCAGLFPTVLRGLFYVGFRIGMYPTIKRGTARITCHSQDSFVVKVAAGAVCGALGSLVFTPLDVVRIRFQANSQAYPSTWSGFAVIYKQGGIQSLWTGVSANVIRVALLSGTQLSVYDQIKISALEEGRTSGISVRLLSIWLPCTAGHHASGCAEDAPHAATRPSAFLKLQQQRQ